MAQQTAVEWLLEQINKGSITFEMTKKGVFIMQDYNIIEQAKQMEKEQIIKAWELRATPYPTEGMGYSIIDATGEEYYNETYGENKD